MEPAAAARIAEIERRLGGGPFDVSRDVALDGGGTAALVASRTSFTWKGLGLLSQHLVVLHLARPTRQDVDSFVERSFALARRRNKVPLLRGMQFGYLVIPVIVAGEVTPDVLDLCGAPPRKRWALFQLPVVCEAATGTAHYFRGTPIWGAFFFSDARALIEKYVS